MCEYLKLFQIFNLNEMRNGFFDNLASGGFVVNIRRLFINYTRTFSTLPPQNCGGKKASPLRSNKILIWLKQLQMHIKHPFLDKKRGKYVVGPTGYYLSFTLSNTIKGTIIASVRSVSSSFVVSHSISKIIDKKDRQR